MYMHSFKTDTVNNKWNTGLNIDMIFEVLTVVDISMVFWDTSRFL
jgi:hypothetical protein